MEQTINFSTKNYFEGVMYILGWIFGAIAIILLFSNWLISPVFVFLTTLIFTSRYKLTIDMTKNEMEDYLFILGAKTQREKFKYSTLKHIYITQSKYNQQLNYKSISSTLSGVLYTAYLKSDTGNHYLRESKDLPALKQKIEPLAVQLNLEVKLPPKPRRSNKP